MPLVQQLAEVDGVLVESVSGSELESARAPHGELPRSVERLLLFALAALILILAVDSSRHAVDFPVYHRIATQIWQGHYELYPEAVYNGGVAPAHGFRYAPAVAFLFVPLAWLSLEHAALLFFGLKIAALIYVGTVATRQAGLQGRSRAVLLLALVCVGGYVGEEFRYGNVHLFIVALMVFAFDAVASGAVVAPAIAVGVAIATKLTPIVLLGYFLARRRFAVCLATIGVLAVLALLPAAVVGIGANNRLLEGFERYAVEKIDEGDNYALRGVLIRYLAPVRQDTSPPQVAASPTRTVSAIWLAAVLVGGLIVAVLLRHAPSGPVPAILDLSIVLTAILLASPHTQRRYFITLYVPVVVLIALVARTRDETDRRLLIFGVAVTAATSTVLPLVFAGRRLALWYEAGSPYFFGTFALLVTLVVLRVRQQQKPGAELSATLTHD